MEKTRELIEAFDYQSEKIPIQLASLEDGYEQGYSAQETEGKVVLKAKGPLGAMYGLYQSQVAIRSGHLPDFLGENNPRFRLRPLYLRSDEIQPLGSHAGLGVPKVLRSQRELDAFCISELQLGYNAVILGGGTVGLSTGESFDLKKALRTIREYGIRVIVQPHTFESNVQQTLTDLSRLFPEVDGLFWKSSYFDCNDSTDAISYDLALEEVKTVEDSLPEGCSFIYHLTSKNYDEALLQSFWFPMFCDDMGENTAVAFSCVAGDVPHPFWNALRSSPDTSATPLLPMLEVEEGNEPVLLLEHIQEYIPRCRRHRFPGIIGSIGQLPEPGTFHHGTLWVLGQVLWRDLSPKQLAESWFAAYRSDIDFHTYFACLPLLQQIAKDRHRLIGCDLSDHDQALLRSQVQCLSDSIHAQYPKLGEMINKE